MDQNWFYLIEQASDMSKIKFLFFIYACCLNKTTKTINKLTNEQPSSHFFLTDPLRTICPYLGIGLNRDNHEYCVRQKHDSFKHIPQNDLQTTDK